MSSAPMRLDGSEVSCAEQTVTRQGGSVGTLIKRIWDWGHGATRRGIICYRQYALQRGAERREAMATPVLETRLNRAGWYD